MVIWYEGSVILWFIRVSNICNGGPGLGVSFLFSEMLFCLNSLNSVPCVLMCLQETSSAQYILQQYMAASGGQKLQSIVNAYAMGKLKMLASDLETATKVIKNRNSSKTPDSGGFVLWQMNPDMWYIELALGSSEVHAGCNGRLVWRHTPWLGTHAAKGPVRPLRRALQVTVSVHSSILWSVGSWNF